MRVELSKNQDDWTISIEPEIDMEQCAIEYLASRPTSQVKILITRLGLFERNKGGVK